MMDKSFMDTIDQSLIMNACRQFGFSQEIIDLMESGNRRFFQLLFNEMLYLSILHPLFSQAIDNTPLDAEDSFKPKNKQNREMYDNIITIRECIRRFNDIHRIYTNKSISHQLEFTKDSKRIIDLPLHLEIQSGKRKQQVLFFCKHHVIADNHYKTKKIKNTGKNAFHEAIPPETPPNQYNDAFLPDKIFINALHAFNSPFIDTSQKNNDSAKNNIIQHESIYKEELREKNKITTITKEKESEFPGKSYHSIRDFALGIHNSFFGGYPVTAFGKENENVVHAFPIPIYGSRESGGIVDAGKNYLVGEKGPEILRMGKESGTIVPNGAIESENRYQVYKTFNVNIANINISAGFEQEGNAIVDQVKRALNELSAEDFPEEAGIKET